MPSTSLPAEKELESIFSNIFFLILSGVPVPLSAGLTFLKWLQPASSVPSLPLLGLILWTGPEIFLSFSSFSFPLFLI